MALLGCAEGKIPGVRNKASICLHTVTTLMGDRLVETAELDRLLPVLAMLTGDSNPLTRSYAKRSVFFVSQLFNDKLLLYKVPSLF